jgi:hypothetical protein
MFEAKIKEQGNGVTYQEFKAETKEELFDMLYQYFKSNQYCWQVIRTFEDKNLMKEYYEYVSKHSEELWWKHATGRDFD